MVNSRSDARLSVDEAIAIIRTDYAGESPLMGFKLDSYSCRSTQAVLYCFCGINVLCIRGSNSFWDWCLNFRLLGRCLHLFGRPGASGAVYHSGFLTIATRVFDWLRTQDHRVDFIVGHSAGAAAAGIVAISINKPAICLATPKAHYSGALPEYDATIVNVLASNDPVCGVPPSARHIGHIVKITGKGLFRHSIRHYATAWTAWMAKTKTCETHGRSKPLPLVLTLALMILGVTSCAELRAIGQTAAHTKEVINDGQAQLWKVETCDLSLGGLDQVPVDLAIAAVRHCLGWLFEQLNLTPLVPAPAPPLPAMPLPSDPAISPFGSNLGAII